LESEYNSLPILYCLLIVTSKLEKRTIAVAVEGEEDGEGMRCMKSLNASLIAIEKVSRTNPK